MTSTSQWLEGNLQAPDHGQLLDPNVTDYDVREVLPERYALTTISLLMMLLTLAQMKTSMSTRLPERKVRPYYVVKK